MLWTHVYDLLVKLVGLTLMVGLLLGIMLPLHVEPRSPLGVGLFATVYLVGWRGVWVPFLRPASNWLYVWSAFDVRPTWAEVRAFTPLFSLSYDTEEGLTWHPCADVSGFPVSERLAELHARAAVVSRPPPGGWWAKGREQSRLARMLRPGTHVCWVAVGFGGPLLLAIATYARLGPVVELVDELTDHLGTPTSLLVMLVAMFAFVFSLWPFFYAWDRLTGALQERSP